MRSLMTAILSKESMKYTTQAILFLLVYFALCHFATDVFAQEDPFASIQEKGDVMMDFIKTWFARSVIILAIISAGVLFMFKKIEWYMALLIMGAGIFVGNAATIAEWLTE